MTFPPRSRWRTEPCKSGLHTSPLCDVNVSGQVWVDMPAIISPPVPRRTMAAERDFRATGKPNLLPVQGGNGSIKASCFRGKNCPPPAVSEGVSVLSLPQTVADPLTCLCNLRVCRGELGSLLSVLSYGSGRLFSRWPVSCHLYELHQWWGCGWTPVGGFASCKWLNVSLKDDCCCCCRGSERLPAAHRYVCSLTKEVNRSNMQSWAQHSGR